MYIDNLYLKNFKHTKEVNLEFSKINLIIGEPGNGKSSILNSIIYMLIDHLDDKIQNYVRWYQDEFIIDSNFSHLGIDYNYNILGNKSSSKRLRYGDEEDLNSDATAYMKGILDPMLTLYSSFSMQDKTTNLIFDKPTARLNKLRTIFSLDEILEKADLMRIDIKENKGKIEILKAEINILENKKFNLHEIPILEDITDLKKELDLMQAYKDVYENQLKHYEKYVEEKQRYGSALKDIQGLTEEIKVLRTDSLNLKLKDVIDYDEVLHNEFINEKNNIEKDIIQLENQKENYAKFLAYKESINNKIEKINEELEQNKPKRIKPYVIDAHWYDEVEGEISEGKISIAKLEDRIDAIEKGKCDRCGAEYSDGDISTLKDELKGTQEDVARNQKVYDEVNQEWKEYTEKKNKNEIIKTKVDSLLQRKEELEKDVIETVDEVDEEQVTQKNIALKDHEREIRNFVSTKKTFEEVKAYNEDIEKRRASIETDIKVGESKIEELNKVTEPKVIDEPEKYDEEKYKSAADKITIHDQKQKEVERLKTINDGIRLDKKTTLKDIEINHFHVDKLQKENRILNESKTVVEKDFTGYCITKGTNYIKRKMNKFFSKIYDRYHLIYENDGKGISFQYTNDFKNYSEVNMSSGFEGDLIAIANRIALTSLQNCGILLLDEVDKYADSETAIRLFDILFNETNINQFFVVSHNEAAKEYITNLPRSKTFEVKQGEIYGL